tara:strand:- start:2158 stop:2625 length:468 start_codon:yes stop_codon:yes gene_type:complete
MNTKKAVFSRLFGKKTLSKTQLKNIDINLSLVGDIDNEYDFLELSYSEASYGVEFMAEWEQKIYDFSTELSIAVDNYVINGAAYSFQETADNMKVKIEELELKAEELGISPDSLISNYEEIKNILDSADSVDTEFRNAYKEVLRASNNLPLADFS